MADIPANQTILTTADGVPLKTKLRRTQRRMKMRAMGLVLPLLAFISITFIWPIGLMVYRGVDNPVFSIAMPNTNAALARWDTQADELPRT